MTVTLIVIGALGRDSQKPGKKAGEIGNQRENRNYLNQCFVKIDMNT